MRKTLGSLCGCPRPPRGTTVQYQLWSGQHPLGSLELPDGTSPAGWLRPTLAYERLLGTELRRACAQLRAGNFRLAPDEADAIAQRLDPALGALVLKTAAGDPLPAVALEIWDDGRQLPPDHRKDPSALGRQDS